MKKTTLILVTSLFFAAGLYAQVDRSKPPAPGPEKAVKIAEYQSFKLENGLRVFVIENHKLPRVQFFIKLLHDPIREGDKAGYASLTGDLMGRGTKTRSKIQLDEEVDYIGAQLSVSSGSVNASGLTKHRDKLLALMTDVLYNPSLQEEELEKLKKQAVSAIVGAKESPGAIAQNVQSVLLYGKDHPYGELETEETINNITVADCRQYYETYFRPNNAYLVIVGDITLGEARSVANNYFSQWVPKEPPKTDYPRPVPPDSTFVALVDRPASVQSVINIAYPIYIKVGSPDALMAVVMNQILGRGSSARLFLNLREQHGYTYGAYSNFNIDNIVGQFEAYTSTRNEVTDSAVYEILVELNRIKDEPVTAEELKRAKAAISGQFARSLERPSTIAGFAINTSKYNLPKDYYSTFLKRLETVSVDDVHRFAKQYIDPQKAYIQVVGKASEIADGLERFGKVVYYDIYGNEYERTASKLPVGVTAEKVIKNYLEAIGGKEKLNAIKAIEAHYKADIGPMKFDVTVLKKTPKKIVLEMKRGNGVLMQRLVSDGERVTLFQAGRRADVDEMTKERILYNSAIFPELDVEKELQVKLVKMENIAGKEAYVLEFKRPSGQRSLVYYDKDTALKIREEEIPTTGGSGLITNWKEYREKDGVQFPWVVDQIGDGMTFSLRLTDIAINPDIADAAFDVK